jgi:hypothetical protein
LQMCFQSFLLRTGRHTILIDTCCGNGKDRVSRPDFHHLDTNYVGALAEAGVKPAHFPPPVFGRVVRSEQGFAYAPIAG